MNNPKSMLLGWGGLVAAAGIGYYYARQEINSRRRGQHAAGTRPTEQLDWKAQIERNASTPASAGQDAPLSTEGIPRSSSSSPNPSDTVHK